MSQRAPELKDAIDEIMPGMIADRRYLHQHPELGLECYETANFVVERLKAMGVEEITTGLGLTGVTGVIRGTGNGPKSDHVVALRADMDALPIEEENDVEYKSKVSGKMHACGHDSHVTMLLATARMLIDRRDRFAGTVKLIFQPGEEGAGGAAAMIKAGVFENPRPNAVFGLHIWQGAPLGTVWARSGVAMVGADAFTISIKGRGGHGAQPHTCIDPVLVGAQIVSAVQTIVSREQDPTVPAVVTVATFHAGTASNVIPDTAELRGTIRTVDKVQRDEIVSRLGELASGIAKAMRAEATMTIRDMYAPPLINDAAMTAIVRAAAAEVVGEDHSLEGPLMVVSEDMAEFNLLTPGCYFFVGSANPDRGLTWGHHHPRFDIDESAMAIGVETMTRSVLRYFNQA